MLILTPEGPRGSGKEGTGEDAEGAFTKFKPRPRVHVCRWRIDGAERRREEGRIEHRIIFSFSSSSASRFVGLSFLFPPRARARLRPGDNVVRFPSFRRPFPLLVIVREGGRRQMRGRSLSLSLFSIPSLFVWIPTTLTEACPCRQATIRMSKYIFVQSGCAT